MTKLKRGQRVWSFSYGVWYPAVVEHETDNGIVYLTRNGKRTWAFRQSLSLEKP